jgi:hypothetical protein
MLLHAKSRRAHARHVELPVCGPNPCARGGGPAAYKTRCNLPSIWGPSFSNIDSQGPRPFSQVAFPEARLSLTTANVGTLVAATGADVDNAWWAGAHAIAENCGQCGVCSATTYLFVAPRDLSTWPAVRAVPKLWKAPAETGHLPLHPVSARRTRRPHPHHIILQPEPRGGTADLHCGCQHTDVGRALLPL